MSSMSRSELEFKVLATFTEITYELSHQLGFAINENDLSQLEKEYHKLQNVLTMVKDRD